MTPNRLRWALVALACATLGVPVAIGATSSAPRPQPLQAGARTPRLGNLHSQTALATRISDFGFKATNSSPLGGAAEFGCFAGVRKAADPCLEVSNRHNGNVFEFLFNGALGGRIQVGKNARKNFPTARPFVTNATGVATGLNADRVDGLHAQDIIDTAVSRASVITGAQGPQGAQGPRGAQGPQGVQGPQGPPGTPLTANESTSGVALPNTTLNTGVPASGDGADLFNGDVVTLQPGTYVVHTTLRAFDNGINEAVVRYAVGALFLDGARQTTLWTPAVPPDSVNAAQAGDVTVVTVASGAAGQLTMRGIVHRTGGAASSSTAAGVTVVVTAIDA